MAAAAPINKVVTKIKLSTVGDEGATPIQYGFMSFGQVGAYADLRLVLKSKSDFHWPFDFLDKEENCRIRPKLESLNDLEKSVCVRQRSTAEVGGEEAAKNEWRFRRVVCTWGHQLRRQPPRWCRFRASNWRSKCWGYGSHVLIQSKWSWRWQILQERCCTVVLGLLYYTSLESWPLIVKAKTPQTAMSWKHVVTYIARHFTLQAWTFHDFEYQMQLAKRRHQP